jgi:hypothetical protein
MTEQITKMEAVRRALAHFGKGGKPAQMQGWIKQQFDIDMSTDHISTAKGQILGKKGGKAKKAAGKKLAPKPQVQPAAASTAPAKASGGKAGKAAGIPLEDILAVKELVGRLGARPLHALIGAFAK